MALAGQAPNADDAEQRAIAYLAREVPNWPAENGCFSCHNNGDAARALYVARASHDVPVSALTRTTAFLRTPDEWDDPKGDPGFSDLKLARIQFAAALTEAYQSGAVTDRALLIEAAERILEDQHYDGFWDVDIPGVVGSPATYGDVLGTYMARRTLAAADDPRFANAIEKADQWFMQVDSAAAVDVAAVVLGLADRDSKPQAKLRETVGQILANQNGDGGWGPYPKSPSEPFDTAISLLALNAARDADVRQAGAIRTAIAKGRSFLVEKQLPAGGWPETTRPSGFQSYAQHISTSGWAALALLQTREALP